MTIAADPGILVKFDNFGDLLESLGGVPPHRVLLRPLPGQATESDLLRLLEVEKRLCELVDGVLVEKPVGFAESVVAGVLIKLLSIFVDERGLGIITVPDGPLRLRKGLVRMPDVGFISKQRLPSAKVPREAIPFLAPDLAIEVLSRTNTAGEMERKRQEYFQAGVRLVWMVDPQTREVEVYTLPTDMRVLKETDMLDGGQVLPGFSISLKTIFSKLDQI